ncbi:hypothetical protein P691DRAFT_657395 [Macrolepiota fuliginosa MF-IS2]|uniref:DUF323 domain-containing protein n=1 Tax=Macrolepiota fuliginosa MF-IS2 TaxID=1400762 RepID=A0A9P6C6S2_9AGAR|nr:hypothetical protein P691DRAFT_657395 [Macrolepiota fuliginosa MF-IS2]
MHFSSSSSSSASSSGRASPSSRATSPSSEKADSSAFPTTCVYAVNSTPEFLTAAFDKHVDPKEGHVLGVVFDNTDGAVLTVGGSWQKEQLGGVTYYVSPFLSCSQSQTYAPSANQLLKLNLASLRSVLAFPFNSGNATLHIIERPTFVFPVLSHTPGFQVPHSTTTSDECEQESLPGNIPMLEEWDRLWAAWDMITLQMIPREMLHQKPIDLRHKCLFYIGHIPTFLDMLLHKSIGGGATEPKHFWKIFERGIDPHVDDPDHCHNHSEVPEKDEDWPTIESIIEFRNGVRQRLRNLYHDLETGKRVLTRNIARTLVMTHEHEGWHIETLLYMLLQRAGTGTRSPAGFTQPPWHILASQWSQTPPPTTPTVTLGPTTLTLGHNDSEALDKLPIHMHDVRNHIFGWDNESPVRTVHVGQFKAEWRPITNGEFAEFLLEGKGKGVVDVPTSWVEDEDEDGVVEYKVRTMFGPVPLEIAKTWPVLTSYDDVAYYAKCKGGRLPTEPELRLFLDTYDVGFEGGANIGFRHWHPTPATMGCDNGGKGSNGGIWEWTSTVFDGHDGLAPTNLFTGYSTDFFDSKHQVVLGASYATIPRLAGRRTVRNFWQHNYPYPWVGARVIYDM